MTTFRSCVTPDKHFVYGIHKPSYSVANLRRDTKKVPLGHTDDGQVVDNLRNFPDSSIEVRESDWIFEIHNPFPFKGATYIDKEWADASASNYERIRITRPEPVSMSELLHESGLDPELLARLPEPLLLSLATCSTDPADLIALAELSCTIEKDTDGVPTGLRYRRKPDGSFMADVHNHLLFEAVANNPALPDSYKITMVIRPGAQGGSEIVGEWPKDRNTHVYEYLRRNSYIGGGHYAANMAEDAIRYSIDALEKEDMLALRHLYDQRTYVRLAEQLGLELPRDREILSPEELETLRCQIMDRRQDPATTATLWGWNFGFDYAPSRDRLHASHQQVHQQYAMLPAEVAGYNGSLTTSCATLPAYGCGDLVAEVIRSYTSFCGHDFFTDYRAAIAGNSRMDERGDLESSLVVWQDANAMLFVPKAQTSQWELQLMTIPDSNSTLAGNIVEAGAATRNSLDIGILMAQKALAGIGAKMVTSIEYSKRIGSSGQEGQPLLYSFLPRLPESPGAFSEAQLRFINGHYPEDFAAVCRKQLAVR